MRNFEKYIESGREKARQRQGYDLQPQELFSLMSAAKQDPIDGLFDNLVSAYYAGIEAGYRMSGNKKRGALK